jgi:hypothetical protein
MFGIAVVAKIATGVYPLSGDPARRRAPLVRRSAVKCAPELPAIERAARRIDCMKLEDVFLQDQDRCRPWMASVAGDLLTTILARRCRQGAIHPSVGSLAAGSALEKVAKCRQRPNPVANNFRYC